MRKDENKFIINMLFTVGIVLYMYDSFIIVKGLDSIEPILAINKDVMIRSGLNK